MKATKAKNARSGQAPSSSVVHACVFALARVWLRDPRLVKQHKGVDEALAFESVHTTNGEQQQQQRAGRNQHRVNDEARRRISLDL
eukprot:6123214-Pleurochrysis_carterae.AAC.3